ncbi:MAG: aminoglycoside 6-adenylyltransferase [Caldilineaceae bacterium]|nr:aminoglycoside 6-adenylyltransferase [Caldilineaceae bacterium]MDE0339104.1 aminoglycoside 6-adenylyltransferase [Caldilineaceae bacterium]
MTTAQFRFINALTAKVEADPRIRAAWLSGSYGKSTDDRWSDVDAHLLVDVGKFAEFQRDIEAWLGQIRPLVFARLMFNGRMVNAMTDEAMRLDIWLHDVEVAEVTTGETRVLYEEDGALSWLPQPGETLTPEAASEMLHREVAEFWRCVSMMPVVVGRGEKLVGVAGNSFILLALTNVLCAASGRRRDRGVKALNGFLLPHHRQCVEEALLLQSKWPEEPVRFPLRLAHLMRDLGPDICAQWQVEYPQAMEESVLEYVTHELRSLGYGSALEELERPINASETVVH